MEGLKKKILRHSKIGMIYGFDDVSEASWKSLKMIRDKLVVEEVKNKIIEEVAKYDREILMKLGNSRRS